jgi:hypothetical protein
VGSGNHAGLHAGIDSGAVFLRDAVLLLGVGRDLGFDTPYLLRRLLLKPAA